MKDNNIVGAIMAEKGPVKEKAYDLEERTAQFGEAIIGFAKTIPRNPVTMPLIGQLVRSGTSVGANYCEADDAESRKDFRHKIGICRKEARETKHWLRMVVAAEPGMREKARTLWQEAKELHLIFVSVRRNTKD
jgi:four helix bundle protein